MTLSPSLSTIIHDGPTPRVSVPRDYNAAVDLLERNLLAGRGSKPAFVDEQSSLTYAELASRCNRVVNLLTRLGIGIEQRVMLYLLDTLDFPALFLGAIKGGVVPVPVSTLATAGDCEYLLNDSRARVLFVSDAVLPRIAPALANAPFLEHVIVVESSLGGPQHSYPVLSELLAAESDQANAAPTSSDDVAFWLYSSGSTGAPKGAMHVHSSLAQTAALYGQGTLGMNENDLVYSVAKLFFAYGLGNSLTFPLYAGATTVLMADRPTTSTVVKLLRRHQPTVFSAVPTFFAALLSDPEFATCLERPPRLSISAGEALPRALGEAWRKQVGTDVLDGIGSTELLHIFISNQPGQVRYGTTGTPVPGYEVKLVDDEGRDADRGALWVKGPSACLGYWRQRERSLAVFHGPWSSTGDYYERDQDGFYVFRGRADDMLKVSGNWVAPAEVESVLCTHPTVLEAGVVGAADETGLIKPKAFVVLRPGVDASIDLANELKAHVKERLAPFKYPRFIEFLAALPRTATGKLQRFKLREDRSRPAATADVS